MGVCVTGQYSDAVTQIHLWLPVPRRPGIFAQRKSQAFLGPFRTSGANPADSGRLETGVATSPFWIFTGHYYDLQMTIWIFRSEQEGGEVKSGVRVCRFTSQQITAPDEPSFFLRCVIQEGSIIFL